MRHMNIWFPEFFTEAHRKREEGEVLVEKLREFGIHSELELSRKCSFIFCGSVWKMNDVVDARKRFPRMQTIHYNWDLYPFQLYESSNYVRANPDIWDPYLDELKTCRDIWVPSLCTVHRTQEFTGCSAVVIKTSIRPWDVSVVSKGDYVVDVIRKYPDVNCGLARTHCDLLSIPLVETCNTFEWEQFKIAIANCAFMVSPQYEASTGGLTLLEGYWHGKPSLISNSPRHGGIDYFGDRATYFQWDNPLMFRQALRQMYDNPPEINIDEAREWIVKEYSEDAMAKRMADRFWELYDESN